MNADVPWATGTYGTIFWDAERTTSYDRISQLATSYSQVRGQWNLWNIRPGPAAGSMIIYYNGNQWLTGGADAWGMTGISSFAIGSAIGGNNYTGYLDEFTAANKTRSADWIKLCYQNQQQNQTLVDLEDYTQWQYSNNINLNTTPSGAGVDTSLSNFPVLIRLTSNNFNFSQAQDSGQDIRFSKSDGAHLPYQVERWDRSNQLAEIWVQADTVYGNNGTQYFTMYWGNSGRPDTSKVRPCVQTANGFAGGVAFEYTRYGKTS